MVLKDDTGKNGQTNSANKKNNAAWNDSVQEKFYTSPNLEVKAVTRT